MCWYNPSERLPFTRLNLSGNKKYHQCNVSDLTMPGLLQRHSSLKILIWGARTYGCFDKFKLYAVSCCSSDQPVRNCIIYKNYGEQFLLLLAAGKPGPSWLDERESDGSPGMTGLSYETLIVLMCILRVSWSFLRVWQCIKIHTI